MALAKNYRDGEFDLHVEHATHHSRVSTATACRDSDPVPKVPDAGKVFGSGPDAYQLMHNGIKVSCDGHYGDWNVEIIQSLKGHHEPQEETVFHEVLQGLETRSTIVELGAFWAYYSMWFLKAVPSGRAFLVEPVLSQLEHGRRNFQINGLQGNFIHAAVSDQESDSGPVDVWQNRTEQVKTVTVDGLLASQGLARIQVLHADIQGHEYNMLLGATRALAQKSIDWIFISTHGNYLHERCLKILRQAGYHIAVEHNSDESFSFDGLIVASAKKRRILSKITRRVLAGSRLRKIRRRIRVNLLEPLGIKPRLF